MRKYILILFLMAILLSSCVGEKWNGIYCNDDECENFVGWVGYDSDVCPKTITFDYNSAEQHMSIRETYYLQDGTCITLSERRLW